MIQSIEDASRTLVCSVDELAKVHGFREFDINRRMAKGADGCDYSPLLTIGDPDEALYETATYVAAAAERQGEAYRQTKKYPALAIARRPQEMRTVLSSLSRRPCRAARRVGRSSPGGGTPVSSIRVSPSSASWRRGRAVSCRPRAPGPLPTP